MEPWVTCHGAFSKELSDSISCKESKSKRKRLGSQDFLETKHLENRLIFLKPRFLARDVVELYFGGNLRGSLVKIFAEKVARGNSVQIALNFPAKSLSIYTNFFSRRLFNNLIENYLTN